MTFTALLLALAVGAPVRVPPAPPPSEPPPPPAAPEDTAPADTAQAEAAPAAAEQPAPAAVEEAASADAASAPSDASIVDEAPPSPVPFAIAGMSAVMSLGTGTAALFISMSLARSLEDADAGLAPLEGYNARNAAFFACTGVAAATGLVALGALGAGLLFE